MMLALCFLNILPLRMFTYILNLWKVFVKIRCWVSIKMIIWFFLVSIIWYFNVTQPLIPLINTALSYHNTFFIHHLFYTSPTRWKWVWVNSGSWWWTGRPGVVQFIGLQRVGQEWATELNWTESSITFFFWICVSLGLPKPLLNFPTS